MLDLGNTPTVLSFDTRAAQARVESLSWVERASIERVFPDRLEVHITERMPFAVWQLGARHYLIDKTGRVLTAVAPNTAPSLPRLAGEGAATAAAALYALLAGYPALAHQVELAARAGRRPPVDLAAHGRRRHRAAADGWPKPWREHRSGCSSSPGRGGRD